MSIRVNDAVLDPFCNDDDMLVFDDEPREEQPTDEQELANQKLSRRPHTYIPMMPAMMNYMGATPQPAFHMLPGQMMQLYMHHSAHMAAHCYPPVSPGFQVHQVM